MSEQSRERDTTAELTLPGTGTYLRELRLRRRDRDGKRYLHVAMAVDGVEVSHATEYLELCHMYRDSPMLWHGSTSFSLTAAEAERVRAAGLGIQVKLREES